MRNVKDAYLVQSPEAAGSRMWLAAVNKKNALFRARLEIVLCERLRFRRRLFRFCGGFFTFQIGVATPAFLDFVMLLSHISLLCGIDSVVYRDEYEDLALEHQRHFLRARPRIPFVRVQDR